MIMGISTAASAVYLPSSNVMSTAQYGDFSVYSLDLLVQCAAANDSRCLPSGPLPIASNAGWTSGQLQIMTGENGQDATTNTPNPIPIVSTDNGLRGGSRIEWNTYFADDPYASPGGNQASAFAMGSVFSPEPGPTNGTVVAPNGATTHTLFAGDRTNTWEVQIGALRNYLGSHDLVFIFDNNQEGDAENHWLQIWGQAEIIDLNGTSMACYQLNNSASPGCAPRVDPSDAFTPGSYVTTYTGYCVDKTTGAAFDLGLGSQNHCESNNGYYVNGNTGSANADNAAFSRALHDFVFSPQTDPTWLLSLDIRTANNNGGAETLWICSNCDIDRGTEIPEPGTLALAGLALIGLARRRGRAS